MAPEGESCSVDLLPALGKLLQVCLPEGSAVSRARACDLTVDD